MSSVIRSYSVVLNEKNTDGSKKYMARISLGYWPDGRRRRRKIYGATKTEVHRKVSEARVAFDNGEQLRDEKTTLSVYVRDWVETTLALDDIKESTKGDYRDNLRRYVVPYLGRHRLVGLTPIILEKWLAELLASGGKDKAGLSPATVRHAKISLSKVLATAFAHGLITRNPVSLVKGPKKDLRPVKAMTAEEVSTILGAAEGWLFVAIYLGVRTGLRPGEVAALQWDDIDFKSGHLSVRHTSKSVPGGGVGLTSPKTQRSLRTVPITDDLTDVLQGWRPTQALFGESPFVVTVEARPLRRDTYTQAYRRLARRCDSSSTPHWLRHTFATGLLEAGKPTAHVAELLGDTETTVAEVYGHVLRPKTELREAIQGSIPISLS